MKNPVRDATRSMLSVMRQRLDKLQAHLLERIARRLSNRALTLRRRQGSVAEKVFNPDHHAPQPVRSIWAGLEKDFSQHVSDQQFVHSHARFKDVDAIHDIQPTFRLQMDDLSIAERQKQATAALERFTGVSLTQTPGGRFLRKGLGRDQSAELGFWETVGLAWLGERTL